MGLDKYFTNKNGSRSNPVSEGSRLPIWVYVEKVEEDGFGLGYKQAIIKYKNSVLGKLIINRWGRFVAITSTKYELIPNEVVYSRLTRMGFVKEYEDETLLVMKKIQDGKEIFVMNSMDGSHSLRVIIKRNVMIPVVSKKHFRSASEYINNLESIINEGVKWFDEVEGRLEKELSKEVGEGFLAMIRDYQQLPQYVRNAVVSEYYREATLLGKSVPAIKLYQAGLRSILGRSNAGWDTKLNLVRELNKLFGVLDVLEELLA